MPRATVALSGGAKCLSLREIRHRPLPWRWRTPSFRRTSCGKDCPRRQGGAPARAWVTVRGSRGRTRGRYAVMTRRKGIYSWENEPADERRSEFRTTVNSDWRQSSNSTFAEPSRLEAERRRRRRRNITGRMIGVAAAVSLTLLALWVMLSRLMSR
jgi:hypothetical protein